MSTILDEIVAAKRQEVAIGKEKLPAAELKRRLATASPPRGFAASLARRARTGPAVIAEIKRGSPSLGLIRPDLNAAEQAAAYAAGGAACLSVLTDEQHFFARNDDFAGVRSRVSLPMLRKDFMVDEWQLAESRAMGADCILLIMSCLTDAEAARFAGVAHDLGLDVLAEAHNADEVKRACEHVAFDLLGINNRNLKTFETREETTLELADLAPDRDRLVAESGLHTPAAIQRLWRGGIRRYLVGEAFVRGPDPRAIVRSFVEATAES